MYIIMASVIICLGAGCSGGGGSDSVYVPPVERQTFEGVWLGSYWEPYTSLYTTTFSTGIITLDGEAVLMNEDGSQFRADGADTYLSSGGGWILFLGQLFEARLLANVWDTTQGVDYYCETGYFDSDDYDVDKFFGSVTSRFLWWCSFYDEY